MSKPLIFSSPLLSNFSTLSNEINTWKMVSPILPIVVLVSWSLKGTNLLSLVICFVTLGPSTFGYSCGTSKICLFDVLACHLLGDGPLLILPSFVLDFLMQLSNIVYCKWDFGNNPSRDLNLHTWTWMCSPLIGAFSKVFFASTSTWILNFNWIKETSLFFIRHFNFFDSWALATLGNIKIEMGLFVFRSTRPSKHPLDLWSKSRNLFDHSPP